MKHAILIALLMQVAGCTKYYYSREYASDYDQPPQPTAVEMQHCPDGHDSLKDVPVAVGLLWITPDFERKIKNVEVWPTGCTPLGNYQTKVVCMQCGLAYDPLRNVWERRLTWGHLTMNYKATHP
jgi:hypothetical protein